MNPSQRTRFSKTKDEGRKTSDNGEFRVANADKHYKIHPSNIHLKHISIQKQNNTKRRGKKIIIEKVGETQ